MSLENRCADAFEEVQRKMGFHDFMEDRIELVDRRERAVESWVFGSVDTVHRVRVDWHRHVQGVLEVSCDCSFFAESFACSHLWATLLTLDHELGVNLIPGKLPLRLEPAAQAVSPPAPLKGGLQDWRRQLALVADLQRAAACTGGAIRQSAESCVAWYRLDLPASEATGRLTLELVTREGDGELRSMQPGGFEVDRLTEGEDRWLVELLSAFPADGGGSRVWLPPLLAELILPRLCATGRFGWQPRPARSTGTFQPMRWQGGEPWRFSLSLDSESGPLIELRGRLLRGGEERSLRDPLLLLTSGGLVAFSQDLGRFSSDTDGPWVTVLRQVGAIRIPRADATEFLRVAEALPHPPGLLSTQPLENGPGQR